MAFELALALLPVDSITARSVVVDCRCTARHEFNYITAWFTHPSSIILNINNNHGIYKQTDREREREQNTKHRIICYCACLFYFFSVIHMCVHFTKIFAHNSNFNNNSSVLSICKLLNIVEALKRRGKVERFQSLYEICDVTQSF